MDISSVKVLGMMSGTSLDGLDIALCTFERKNQTWNFTINDCETIKFEAELLTDLCLAPSFNAEKFWNLHIEFGRFLGKSAKNFLEHRELSTNIISSHGHTIFHQPGNNGFTCQLGHGAEIAALTGIPCISDFRSLDVALGGQGAPLVPLGDQMLFSTYEACLNLGGIANISIHKNNKLTAFDICAVNQILNHIAKWKNADYDINGEIGKSGQRIENLFNSLNSIPYFNLTGPKSLGREWVEKEIFSLLNTNDHSTEDIACTVYHHIQFQIEKILRQFSIQTCLLSGGGTHNKFLLDLIQQNSLTKLIIPEKKIIDFKESLIFAFLGLMRFIGENNTLSSVTGAKKNSSGGCIFLP